MEACIDNNLYRLPWPSRAQARPRMAQPLAASLESGHK